MRISVIIATFNREALLDECLQHLRVQRFQSGDEVIVVDNGSTDGTCAVIEQHAAGYPVPLRYLHEVKPGKSIAVSRAVAVAAGDVFAFTDDDVNVDAGWLEALRMAIADPAVALVGGRVRPRWEGRPPDWFSAVERPERLAAPLALADYGDEAMEFGPRTAMGGNMAVRREVLEQLGGFAANLGSVRGTLLTGEDQELSRRVQAAGLRAIYQPTAIVYHWVPVSRVSVRYFLRWFFWSGIANATQDDARVVPPYLIRRLATGIAAAPILALRGRLIHALDRAVDAAYAVGYVARCWRVDRTSRSGEAA
jgi:GT2 family glycosyltransferase